MRNVFLLLWMTFLLARAQGQAAAVVLTGTANGTQLVVAGQPLLIKGMNWDYFPIGTNYNYILWEQPEAHIKAALETEMSALQQMGVNAIRQYTGVPPRWITYIYEQYGIYTMLNHPFGRYGLTIAGEWVANTDYADPRVQELLLTEVRELAGQYRNTPGLLMYLLGNENNYGLFWEGAATENIPLEDRPSTGRARAMYALFNQAALAIQAVDRRHPVALCNGDLLFLDIIAELCPDIDIFGANMYRGASFGDAFEQVKKVYGKPLLFTEFGADAYHSRKQREDQRAQAHYLRENWQEIYQNTAGMGQANTLGGFTFQFTDGWWKLGQTTGLDVHDQEASWANGGYRHDYVEGVNNMNEEWFGICAKGPTRADGRYAIYPRAAFFTLQKIHQLDPYADDLDAQTVEAYFRKISLSKMYRKARRSKRKM